MYDILTSVWFPALLSCIALIVAALLILRTVRMLRVSKVCSMKQHGTGFIYDYLRIYFPEHCLFKNLPLIDEGSMFVIGKNSQLIKRTADIAYVGRGGILLLTVVPDTGCFDTPKVGNWKHSRMVQGQAVTKTVVNPFDATNPHPSAIENLLSSEDLREKNITRAVVLTGKGVLYTTVYKELLSPGTLLRFVRSFNMQKSLSGSEIRQVCKLFSSLYPASDSQNSGK